MHYETLGAFGFSWQEKAAKNIGFPVTFLNASTYGGIVNTMYKIYVKNKNLDYDSLVNLISADSGQSRDIVIRFLEEMRKREATGTTVLSNAEKYSDPLKTISTYGKLLTVAAILIGGGYLLSNVRTFLPKTN